jgi:outer membrane protein assembly factor BamD (BamD/ComL family)
VPAPEPAAQRVALARELELLDAAERAERRGDHAAALVSLDEYARAFPDGAMLAEAKVLRIAALVGNGDEMSAQDLAQAFLARYAPSPLTARVRSMLSKISNAKEKLP